MTRKRISLALFFLLILAVVGVGTITTRWGQAAIDRPKLIVRQSVDQPNAKIGDIVIYTVKYQNSGPGNIKNLKLEVTLPPGIELVTGTAVGAKVNSRQLVWNSDFLQLNAQNEVSFKAKLVAIPSSQSSSDDSPTNSQTIAPTSGSGTKSGGGLVNSECNPGSGTDYQVGPGKRYANLGEVPWDSLNPGDSVRVAWRSQPYNEKLFLMNSGTSNNPILFCGIPGPNGELPIIDGNNATTNNRFKVRSAAYLEQTGTVVMTLNSTANYNSGHPKYWRIKNLRLQGANGSNEFRDSTGVTRGYDNGASGLYIWRAENVTITNVELTENGNGFFVNSGGGLLSRNITLEGSHIFNNGTVGSDRQHNAYTEAAVMIYQYNRFGHLRDGAKGSNIKDRSSGTIVRYNWVDGGAHSLDLVDAENSKPSNFAEPNYFDTYVYGNVLINGPGAQGTGANHGSATMIHFGGDTGFTADYRKRLFFYHNTVITVCDKSGTNSRWRTVLFSLDGSGQTVEADNNIIFTRSLTSGVSATEMSLLNAGSGNARFGINWVSPGWLPSATNGPFTGSIAGTNNFISPSTNDAGVVSTELHAINPQLKIGSGAINSGNSLTSPISFNPHQHQYQMHQNGIVRSNNGKPDLGAYEF